MTEMTKKSAVEIVLCRWNASDMALARTASAAEIDNVDTIDAAMFCPASVSIRAESRKVPA